jgi:hypothetical protein
MLLFSGVRVLESTVFVRRSSRDEKMKAWEKQNALKIFKFYLIKLFVNAFIKFKIFSRSSDGTPRISEVTIVLSCNAYPFFSRPISHMPISSMYYYFVYLFTLSGFLRCYPNKAYMESDYNIHALIPLKDVTLQNK